MFVVFWLDVQPAGINPQYKEFDSEDMMAAMTFMESLRQQQRSGCGVCHVTMSSENPHSVGRPGVDVTGPDYHWRKRRI
jgi:hypothetical protein